MKKPLDKEIICAGNAFSVDVKCVDRIILKPAKGMDVKYNLSPFTAVCCKLALCSLLNIPVIELEHNKNMK